LIALIIVIYGVIFVNFSNTKPLMVNGLQFND